MRHDLSVLFCTLISVWAALCLPLSGHAGETRHSGKPLSPLQVSITPIQSTFVPANIKPGDAAEFKIIFRTFTDTDMLDIVVELNGLDLVSGTTSWTGAVKKGEDHALLLTVRVPKHGRGGLLRARISLPPTSGAQFASEVEYRLGQSVAKKLAPLPNPKKDGKGRAVREYRAQ